MRRSTMAESSSDTRDAVQKMSSTVVVLLAPCSFCQSARRFRAPLLRVRMTPLSIDANFQPLEHIDVRER
jgi:hypothetical protein